MNQADITMASESVSSKEPLCKILQVGSAFLIFNSDDAMKLRQNRIVGDLIGTVHNAIHRDDQLTLPLRLLLEEVVFLVSQGIAEIVRYKSGSVLPSGDAYQKAYDEWLQLEIDRQSSQYHQTILDKRLALSHRIAYGRKAKKINTDANDSSPDDGESAAKISKRSPGQKESEQISVTPEDIMEIEEEIRAMPMRRLKESETVKEVWLDFPLFSNNEQFESVTVAIEPKTELQKLRCAVFADLWQKGYYLTAGVKFGGDFLAYPGDPILYHASHIVICTPEAITYDSIDITAIGRLGSQVKKVVLLCAWDKRDKSKIRYITLQWKRFDSEDQGDG